MVHSDMEILQYSVGVYDFLIRGKGHLNGKQFADAIRGYYDNERSKICADIIEKYITDVFANYRGIYYKYRRF